MVVFMNENYSFKVNENFMPLPSLIRNSSWKMLLIKLKSQTCIPLPL